jgi:hypothetical protein
MAADPMAMPAPTAIARCDGMRLATSVFESAGAAAGLSSWCAIGAGCAGHGATEASGIGRAWDTGFLLKALDYAAMNSPRL